MLVAFSDSENELEFNPTTTNSAGSVRLSSGSLIIGGLKSRQETLIWTDTSLYSMTFIGPPLTFALNLINEGSGLISPKAAVNSPVGIFFMSKNGFYYYNGSVKRLPCSVQDYVFSDLDLGQAFKCFAALNSENAEVWFFLRFYRRRHRGDIAVRDVQLRRTNVEHWFFGAIQLVGRWH